METRAVAKAYQESKPGVVLRWNQDRDWKLCTALGEPTTTGTVFSELRNMCKQNSIPCGKAPPETGIAQTIPCADVDSSFYSSKRQRNHPKIKGFESLPERQHPWKAGDDILQNMDSPGREAMRSKEDTNQLNELQPNRTKPGNAASSGMEEHRLNLSWHV